MNNDDIGAPEQLLSQPEQIPATPGAFEPADVQRPSAAFLLSASDVLAAGAYEEMLRKNGIYVIQENRGPGGPYAAAEAARYTGGRRAPGLQAPSPVNLYVSQDQLERARELAHAFDNEPVVYNTPVPPLNRKSAAGRVVFAAVIFFIFVIPLGVSLYIIVDRVIRLFR